MRFSRGFSLIEIIVSVFIVGVILVLLHAVILSASLVKSSKNQNIALSIARNKLEGVRAGGYSALPMNGPFSDTLLGTLPRGATTTLTVSTYNTKTKQIDVSVVWLDQNALASSTVSLRTLITETGGLP
ncbi:prepilin-type N-terminal cleavage/methylation domain-containing protein [Candidatus Kaiserbacteria bacterium]|nr:prepilin-type N-terminal cleavage/methylation domain-containing protein [Candidatus Kaiserbacteria bacterium]